MIRFVSNLPRDLRTGGFSAINAAACAAISRRHELVYAGPIDPPVSLAEKVLSKALRLAGQPGDFYYFSARRLAAIARAVAGADAPHAALDFFHGFTPWIATQPTRPYMTWSDCNFRDYIDTFHTRARFRAQDLARIEAAEARWLKGARRVLFTSDWAAARTTALYGLDPARVGSVGIFGELEPPEADTYAGRVRFAFISTNFAAKGGPMVLAAFRELRLSHPEAELVIVGAAGPQPVTEPGVETIGLLRKESADEHRQFRDILATSLAVAHPTTSDISPLVVIEAALFGTPTIASRAFAIPEIIEDGVSGYLLNVPVEPKALAEAMRWMIEHPVDYARMRKAAWRRAGEAHGKTRFEARLLTEVDAVLSAARAPA